MASTLIHRLRCFGGTRAAVLGAFLLIVGGGLLAYRHLFHHPGEAAIQLIPGDALMVWTLDTSPSQQQVAAFKRISDAIQREGLDTQMESLIGEMFEKSPIGKELRPYVMDSFAVAFWDTSGRADMSNPDIAFLIAVTEPDKVGALLARRGKKQSLNGMDYYLFMQDDVNVAIIANYLVIASKPAALARIESVRNGQITSVAALPEYQQARAALPEDANMMFFIAPRGLAQMGEQTKGLGANPFLGTKWLAFSATVRDQGLLFDYRAPMDADAIPALKRLAAIAPIDPAALKRLPPGAYGLLAYAQPGKYWDYLRDIFGEEPNLRQSLDEGVAAFEKETGLSVSRDIVPALGGQFLLAVYPDARGADYGVDGLIVIDDAHGADPAALSDKLRAYIERATAQESGRRVRFVSTEREGVIRWSLDTETQKQMRRELAEAFTSPRPPQTADFPAPDASGARRPAPGTLDKHIQNKTVAYVQVGKAVLMASSQNLLERAVSVYKGTDRSLADEPSYAAMREMLVPNAQSLFMVSLSDIMEALRPTLEKAMKDGRGGPSAADLVGLFGTASAGLVGSGRYDGQVMTGNFFLPLDYERLIRLIGSAARPGAPDHSAALSR